MTRSATRLRWAKLIDAWKKSGQSARVFGEAHGVSASSVYGWSREFRRKGLEVDSSPEAGFIRLVMKEEEAESTRVEIRWTDGMTVALSGSRALEGLEIALRSVRGRGRA